MDVAGMAGRMAERRGMPRLCADATRRLQSRLRPGTEIALIDFSAGGALIESDRRLLPGVRVELQVLTQGGRFDLAGWLIRAEVASLSTNRVRYRGAIQFDRASGSVAASLGRLLEGSG